MPAGTPIQFQGGGETPVQYWVEFQCTEYFVHYRGGLLNVYASDDGPVKFTTDELCLGLKIGDQYDGHWNARETNVYLALISDSIISGAFNSTDYPTKATVRAHRHYQLGPLPEYPVGLVCGHFEKPPPPENDRMNRHDRRKRSLQGIHDHNVSCYAFAAAQDVTRWIAEHPSEHEGLKAVYPTIWRDVARDLELAH